MESGQNTLEMLLRGEMFFHGSTISENSTSTSTSLSSFPERENYTTAEFHRQLDLYYESRAILVDGKTIAIEELADLSLANLEKIVCMIYEVRVTQVFASSSGVHAFRILSSFLSQIPEIVSWLKIRMVPTAYFLPLILVILL